MTKIKIFTFPNGKQGFATGNIEVSMNKQEPVSIEEIELKDEKAKEFLDNPVDSKPLEELIKEQEAELAKFSGN